MHSNTIYIQDKQIYRFTYIPIYRYSYIQIYSNIYKLVGPTDEAKYRLQAAPPSHCSTFPSMPAHSCPRLPQIQHNTIQLHIQLQIQHNGNTKTHTSTNTTQYWLNIVFGLLKYNTNIYQIQRYITIHVYCLVERYIWITNEIQRCEQFGWFTSVPISMYYNAMHIIIIPSPNWCTITMLWFTFTIYTHR